MLDLIGEGDSAARIKPSVRRRGVTAESDESEADTEPGADGESGSPAATGSPAKATPDA